MIGGSGEKVTLRLTAEHAQAWNSFGPPAHFAAKNAILNDWCAKVGRNPAEIERTVAIEAKDVNDLDAYVEAGAEHVIVMTGYPFDLDAVAKLQELASRQRQ